MKIGLALPNNWGIEDPNSLVDLAVQAEERGFDSVWFSEHLINTTYVRSRIGVSPYHHPLAMLAATAARTSIITIGTSILILPFHNPFDVAKFIATLDQLTRGRIVLGAGVGNVQEEFAALGVPWERRGALTDESLVIMKKLWAEGAASHEGKAWNFSDVYTSPKPYKDRQVPIWVGGMSPAAHRRAVNLCNGWQPTGITPDELRSNVETLRGIAAASGRSFDDFDIAMRFNIALGDEEVTDVELRSTVKGDDKARIVDVVSQFREAGVTHFIYALNSNDPAILKATIDQLAHGLL